MAASTPAQASGTHEEHLERNLSNRHIQLIAIGGAIGTGLFMGSGKTISIAGPSILLVYLVVGCVLFFVMRAIGELLLHNLQYKSFQDFAADILGPWAGFFIGWTYWLCWIVTGMADLIATAGYWNFWVNPGRPTEMAPLSLVLTIGTLLLLLFLNLLTVKLFGELEFWFALIKVIAIITLIIVGVVLVVTGFHTSHGTAAFSNLWRVGGFFPNGMDGFLGGFQIAVFAFVGIELVGTTAAETKDPEKTLPKAINSIPIRVMVFYLGSLAVIMSVTPWVEIDPHQSPFVTIFGMVGLAAAASVMNFVVLTSAASACNSGLYSTSRMLFGLAHKGMAPGPFGALSSHKVPRNALFLSVVLVGSSVLLMMSESVMAAFTMVTTISAILFIFVWSVILASYLKYLKERPEAHRASSYKVPGAHVMPWVCLAFFVFVLAVLWKFEDTRPALIGTPVWFVILGVAWAIIRHRVHADDSGVDAVEADQPTWGDDLKESVHDVDVEVRREIDEITHYDPHHTT